MKKIAVFASGHGTNFEAIDDNIKKGYLDASIELLVVDQKKAEVIDKAKERGVETLVLSPKDFSSKKEYEECILERLKEKDVEWIVLAGYMRIVTNVLLDAYPNRIINIISFTKLIRYDFIHSFFLCNCINFPFKINERSFNSKN